MSANADFANYGAAWNECWSDRCEEVFYPAIGAEWYSGPRRT
jgi:hypothetical protein